MLSERKRSVTFENEGGGGILGVGVAQGAGGTQRSSRREAGSNVGAGVPMLDLVEENDKTEMDEQTVATYREEGERVLDEAVEKALVNRRLEEQAMMNGELKDLYEMQLYEQRKLQNTVNDVKKQVGYFYNYNTNKYYF